MGRGDKRSRKGKIWRGTYGKSRPRPSNDESGNKEQPKEKEQPAKESK